MALRAFFFCFLLVLHKGAFSFFSEPPVLHWELLGLAAKCRSVIAGLYAAAHGAHFCLFLLWYSPFLYKGAPRADKDSPRFTKGPQETDSKALLARIFALFSAKDENTGITARELRTKSKATLSFQTGKQGPGMTEPNEVRGGQDEEGLG